MYWDVIDDAHGMECISEYCLTQFTHFNSLQKKQRRLVNIKEIVEYIKVGQNETLDSIYD